MKRIVDFFASDQGKALTVIAALGTYALSAYVSYLNQKKTKLEMLKLGATEEDFKIKL